MANRYKVVKRESHYYIEGLKPDYPTAVEREDTILLYHYTAAESEYPEVDSLRTKERMHGALYDLFQRHEGLHDGDSFDTPFGVFLCRGVHVVSVEETA